MSAASHAAPIADADTLGAAIRLARPGAVLTLADAEFRLDTSLVLERTLTLRGAGDAWPRLRFTTPDARLSIRADGCAISNLVLMADGHRAAPLLDIVSAADATLAGIAPIGARGMGIRAEDCRNLRIAALEAAELDAEAVVATRCTAVAITGACRGTGRAHRASAILLDGCNDFTLALEAEDVSGSAVTIRSDAGAPMAGSLSLRARQCFRALTVIGDRQRPAEGLSARVDASEYADCAIALVNARAAAVDLTVARGSTPAIRLDGGFGARNCMLAVASDHADADALIEQRGGSSGNTILGRADSHATDSVPASTIANLPPHLARLIGARFPITEVEGACSVCGRHGRFRRTLKSLRETLACEACRATLRYRGQAEALLRVIADGRHASLRELAASGALAGLAIFEPGISGPLRPYLSRAGCYHRSFYEPGLPSGTLRDGIACQDLMATSHPDGAFDLVVTSDILEHVREPVRAFAEIRRILRPGGAHVFTVPLQAGETRVRVDTTGQVDRHLLPPVYHGAGRGGSSLVYTEFGRDIGRILRGAGMDAEIMHHAVPGEHDAPAATLIARRAA
jgi:SAM-dependent methyltransferase